MRIRKSISEGYKSQSASISYKPSATGTLGNFQAAKQSGGFSPPSTLKTPRNPHPLPKSGITCPVPAFVPGEDDLPSLLFPNDSEFDLGPSSQDSNASATSGHIEDAMSSSVKLSRKQPASDFIRANWKKRGHDDGETDICLTTLSNDKIIYSDVAGDNNYNGEKTSTKYNPNSLHQLRPIAQPRRRKASSCVIKPADEQKGPHGTNEQPDFEEAPFFRAEDWMEVEMENSYS